MSPSELGFGVCLTASFTLLQAHQSFAGNVHIQVLLPINLCTFSLLFLILLLTENSTWYPFPLRSTPNFLFDKQNNLSVLRACWKALGGFPPGALRSFGSFLHPLLPATLPECCYHTGGSGLGFMLPAWITGVYDLLPHYSQWNVHYLSPQLYAVSSCAVMSSKTPSRASAFQS